MFALIIISIAAISLVLALISLWQQNKLEEIKGVKKALKKKKIIYQRDSSASLSSSEGD